MTVDVLLFILLISDCRKAQRAMRIRIYQDSTATLGRGMRVNHSHFYSICVLCHISFPHCGRHCLVCFIFLCIFLHALACFELYRASSEEMFSHSRSRNCYTSHPSVKTRCRVYYNTLSAGQEWTGTHTEYLRWHWKPPLSSLPLWSTHTGPSHCSFEQFQCGIRLIHLNYHNICWAVSDSAFVPNLVVYSSAGPLWARP